MVDRFQVIPASYVIFRRGDHVLLQLRQGTGYMDGYWACAAAGHVETGESVVEAATREAHEELGVLIEPDHLVPLTTMHRTQGSGQAIDERVDFFFTCTAWRGGLQIMEPDKVADLRWFPLDDLPAAVVPHERYVLERLRSGLAPIITVGFTTQDVRRHDTSESVRKPQGQERLRLRAQ